MVWGACWVADNKLQLLLATENNGKKKELISFLGNIDVEPLLPGDLPHKFKTKVQFPPETGDNFAENAFIKADYIFQQAHLATLADDSGISVPSLGNFPGVRSARWLAGTDQDRNAELLKKMATIKDRSAFFTCVLCLLLPENSKPTYFEGIFHGSLAFKPAGSSGFGYDSIFIPNGEEKTLAELGEKYKLKHSHRTIALQKLASFLKEKVVQ